jgi:hypothetical protein
VDENHSNWAAYLYVAEFACNATKNATIGVSPFMALYGYEPALRFHFAGGTHEGTEPYDRLKRLSELRDALSRKWETAVATQAREYNKRHKPRAFEAGELVILSTRDLRLRLPSKKLAPRYLGPFRIAEAVGTQAYRLHLPPSWRIHDVFNVSRLEPYYRREGTDLPSLPPAILMEDQTEEWEVERILGKRKTRGTTEYRVRWVGWPPEYDQWVDAVDIHATDLINEYEQSHPITIPRKRGRPKRTKQN